MSALLTSQACLDWGIEDDRVVDGDGDADSDGDSDTDGDTDTDTDTDTDSDTDTDTDTDTDVDVDSDTDVDSDSDADADPTCPSGDAMVHVPAWDICIDAYEASEGSGGRARSVYRGTPWVFVDHEQASQACALAGKRLCDADEWQAACAGPSGLTYPYGNSYRSDACNGTDHGADAVLPTGQMSDCEGGYPGLFDMSGNAMEWTATCSGGSCYIAGGCAWDQYDLITCDRLSEYLATFSQYHVGFRCCLSL